MGTHCGWPQWACRPPRCRVLSTIRPHCMAASAPAHTSACSGEPPLQARAGRGQSECPEALSSCTQGLHGPRLPDAPPRGHCPGHGGHFASPWPPPHHLFLISLSSPAACLPSPTQHQAQHNPQPQLVLIRAGGWVREGEATATLPGPQACSKAPTSWDTRRFLGGVWVCSSPQSASLSPSGEE